jgi:TolB protein
MVSRWREDRIQNDRSVRWRGHTCDSGRRRAIRADRSRSGNEGSHQLGTRFGSRDGREIVFCSDRSGGSEIWSKDLETGRSERLTTIGGISYPELSPDGKKIAFIHSGEGLFVLDRQSGAVTRIESPRMVYFRPAWSPDGRFIAVTGKDWGKTDIYLMNADGRNALLLTKSGAKEGTLAWSPDGESLAVVSIEGSGMSINILTGIDPYKDRILSPAQVGVFRPPR